MKHLKKQKKNWENFEEKLFCEKWKEFENTHELPFFGMLDE